MKALNGWCQQETESQSPSDGTFGPLWHLITVFPSSGAWRRCSRKLSVVPSHKKALHLKVETTVASVPLCGHPRQTYGSLESSLIQNGR